MSFDGIWRNSPSRHWCVCLKKKQNRRTGCIAYVQPVAHAIELSHAAWLEWVSTKFCISELRWLFNTWCLVCTSTYGNKGTGCVGFFEDTFYADLKDGCIRRSDPVNGGDTPRLKRLDRHQGTSMPALPLREQALGRKRTLFSAAVTSRESVCVAFFF